MSSAAQILSGDNIAVVISDCQKIFPFTQSVPVLSPWYCIISAKVVGFFSK